MKRSMLFIAFLYFSLQLSAQTSFNHSAGDLKSSTGRTWSVDNVDKITIAPAPDLTQSKKELIEMRKGRKQIDIKVMEEIKYWDAGAPSYRWNQIAPALISYDNFQEIARTPTAWMNLAIYDATILAWKEKAKHKRLRPAASDPSITALVKAPDTYSYPCEHSVTAAAAVYVLAYFFPDKADSIMELARAASRSRINAGVQFASDTEAGWSLGEQVAKQIIEKASNDGSTRRWTGTMNKDPKKWTGPFALGVDLPLYSPIVLQSASQFRPSEPPAFEKDMKELKAFKQTFNSSYLAYYWANNGGFDFWSEVAALKMFEYGVMDDAVQAARIYTVLHTAFHDAVISIMDAKYAYWGIRPDQYDTSFKPLLRTPPFPGYPSGHAAGAGTTSAVMEYFFPQDAGYFRKLAQDCADSRFYAGIHFKADNEIGLEMGRKLGRFVAETLMSK